MMETTSYEKRLFPNSQFTAFLICILISLLPGIVISVSLFANAFINDIKMKNICDGLPSTDLSQIRIEGYDLNQHITDYKPEVNFCDVTFENGKRNNRYTKDSNVYIGDSPIASIDMPYPVVEYSWDGEIGTETWQKLTIENTPIPDFDNVIERLGKNYALVDFWRGDFGCFVYIDRENNIELRFSLGYSRSYSINDYDEIDMVELTRIDNRTTMEFIKEWNNFGDRFEKIYSGTWVLGIWELPSVLGEINTISMEHQFLYHIEEYFYIPIYFATWTFPLVWAIHKKKRGWTIAACVWYPLWYFFGVLTLLVRQ